MAAEVETLYEQLSGISVRRDLAWHQIGCLKRYGAESEVPCECERMAEAAKKRASDSA